MRKSVAVLGSTGSVGRQALEVIEAHPGRFSVVALAAGANEELLLEQVRKHRPKVAVLGKGNQGVPKDAWEALRGTKLLFGEEGLLAAATHPDVETVVLATSGIAGLRPLIAALRAGKRVALANKESLVVAGDAVMAAARASAGGRIIPVDSEHNAVFQCLEALGGARPSRIVLTASGGPFLRKSAAEMEDVGPAEALAHPTWKMGPKVTVDSATLMNKGFEVIEARWLFSVPPEQISVVINPGSVVHCFVEAEDGTVFACMGSPDMRSPIQHALFYPERVAHAWGKLDVLQLGNIPLEPPDLRRFPCLGYAYEALRSGIRVAAAMCGADEAAVAEFLDGRLRFGHIPVIIKETMDEAKRVFHPAADAREAGPGNATGGGESDPGALETAIEERVREAESIYAWGFRRARERSRALRGGEVSCTSP